MADDKIKFKIITVGDPNVGKTSLIKRHCNKKFDRSIPSTFMDYSKTIYKYQDKTITLEFWDTVGAEKFRSLTRNYFRGAQGVFIVYDITNETSLIKLQQRFDDLEEMADQNVVKILVGTKCDMESDRVVERDTGKLVADYFKVPFFEVSSKTNEHVDGLMFAMVSKIYALVADTMRDKKSFRYQDLVVLSNNTRAPKVPPNRCAC